MSLDAALASATDGDRVYVPSGTPRVAPSGGFEIAASLELYGDGAGADLETGTILRAADANSPVIRIVPPAANVRIHDLQLQRGGTGPGSGVGILCQSTAQNPTVASGLIFSGLRISGFPSHGVHLEGHNDSTARIHAVALLDLIVNDCGGSGVHLSNVFDVHATSCAFRRNQLSGLSLSRGSLAMKACTFDGNAGKTGLSDPEEGNLRAIECELLDVDGCRFVGLQTGEIRKGIVCRDTAGFIGNSQFVSASASPACSGIVLRGTACGPWAILGSRYDNIASMLVVESGVKAVAVYPQYDDSLVGTISLPSTGAIYGAPHIVRGLNQPSGIRGMQVPVVDTVPDSTVSHQGMLAYKSDGEFILCTVEGWKHVNVHTP